MDKNKKIIREKWTDKARSLWPDWYMFEEHEKEPNNDDVYLNTAYDKIPDIFKNAAAVLFLFVIRFAVEEAMYADIGNVNYIILNVIFGLCAAVFLYFFKLKGSKKTVICLVTFIIATLILFPFDFFISYIQKVMNIVYFIAGEAVSFSGVLYCVIRIVISGVVIVLFKIKFDHLKVISPDIYSQAEIKTYKCFNILILFMPIYAVILLAVNMINNGAVELMFFFIGLIVILLLLFRIMLGIKYSYRISEIYAVAAYLFAVESVYELLYLVVGV